MGAVHVAGHLGGTATRRNQVSLLAHKCAVEKDSGERYVASAILGRDESDRQRITYVRDDVRAFLDLLEQMNGKSVEEVGAVEGRKAMRALTTIAEASAA